ncbi:MAG: hypothetical protein OEX02_19945, partial [Cyclobacteriaceae bacterium]|nr:hypothetical protein [Cyclobacteriaceae bacterium]
MLADITTLTRYNHWANQRIANWLLSNELDKLDLECDAGFQTIGLTINHIWDAQIFYLSILKQIPFAKTREKTTMMAIEGLVEQSNVFANYSSGLKDKELLELRTMKTKFLSGSFTQYQLIQHCMNHSTYHRGQIVTMGHQLNLSKAPSTD